MAGRISGVRTPNQSHMPTQLDGAAVPAAQAEHAQGSDTIDRGIPASAEATAPTQQSWRAWFLRSKPNPEVHGRDDFGRVVDGVKETTTAAKGFFSKAFYAQTFGEFLGHFLKLTPPERERIKQTLGTTLTTFEGTMRSAKSMSNNAAALQARLPNMAASVKSGIDASISHAAESFGKQADEKLRQAAKGLNSSVDKKIGKAKSALIKGTAAVLATAALIGALLIVLDKYLGYKVQQRSLKDTLNQFTADGSKKAQGASGSNSQPSPGANPV